MLELIANRLAVRLRSLNPDHPVSLDVQVYALAVLLNTVFTITLSLTLAIILKQLLQVLLVLGIFGLLRQLTGGFHLKSGLLCVLASSFTAILLSYASFPVYIVITLNLISALLILIFAPSRTEGQTRIPQKLNPLMKGIAIAIVSLNFIFYSSVMAATLFVQSLTLIHIQRKDVKQ